MKSWNVIAYVLVVFLFCLNVRAEVTADANHEFEFIAAEEVSTSSICSTPPCFVDGVLVTLKFVVPCNNPVLHYDYKIVSGEVPTVVVSALVRKEKGLTCKRYTYTKRYIELVGEQDIDIMFIGQK